MVVTPNAQRFLGVAALLESKDNLKPVRSRPENRIIGLYSNMEELVLSDYIFVSLQPGREID